MSALPEGLLTAVRNYLDITWEDPAGDEKLSGIIARGMNKINELAGEELDYVAEGEPRRLLFIYCMYDISHAADDFFINYQSDILSLQYKKEVERYIKECK